MKETLFIVNPRSARGETVRAWVKFGRRLDSLGIQYREHATQGPGEATAVTREALTTGTSRVIAVGGDGTLNEVICGYLGPDGRAINGDAEVGLLPSGTGSDFRRSISLRDQNDLISALNRPAVRLIDAARAHFADGGGATLSRHFINIASFGLGGDVSACVNLWRERLPKWIGGRARFVAAALRALGRYRNVATAVSLDDGPGIKINSNLIVVANGRFAGGGMMLAPNARLDDGLLDIILTDGTTRFDIIKELPQVRRGRHLRNPKVTQARARRISIVTEEPLAIDIDGEMVGYTPARVEVLPSAVRFLVRAGD